MGDIVLPLSEITIPDPSSASADRESTPGSRNTGGNSRFRCDRSRTGDSNPSFRTGGIQPQKVLDGLVNDALGNEKLDAWFDGFSVNTRTRYLRGWERCCQFCKTRKGLSLGRYIEGELGWGYSRLHNVRMGFAETSTVYYPRKSQRRQIRAYSGWTG